MTGTSRSAVVVGAGPAGLMAAEDLARAGVAVTLAEAKASPGRKFLMAGKSGLNLTKDEPLPDLIGSYAAAADWIGPMVAEFGPDEVKAFARDLGQEVFTGSTRRVFPVAMKASPMLRAWLARLEDLGVVLRTRWRWAGWEAGALVFETPQGRILERPGATVLALGGASWARLGSDGTWAAVLAARGVEIAPFRPANVGLSVDWSAHMARFLGAPVKGAALAAGPVRSRGEFVVVRHGIEGGGVYAVSAAVRDGAALSVDLVPDLDLPEVERRLAVPRPGDSLGNRLRKALGLDPVKLALLQEWGRPLPSGGALAGLVKALPVPHRGPRPMDEAISTAGGIARAAVTEGLELRALPGVFVCGEMLDWEAPTGGYLLTACFATGRRAGRSAAALLAGEGSAAVR